MSAFDGHRSDTDEPLVFVTEDHGKTWKSLRANLPSGSTRMLREDIRNPDLLYLGTEFAIWASLDRGISWVKINNNLPTVAVLRSRSTRRPTRSSRRKPTDGASGYSTSGRSASLPARR